VEWVASQAVVPPPALNLIGSLPRGGWPTDGFRSGECSPDCNCVTGRACGDRVRPGE
jgi:hypothetical protein